MSKNPFIRWTIYVGVAIVFAIVCGFLANWQFDRSEGRNEEIAIVEQNYEREPVPFDEAVADSDVFDPQTEWLPVTLEGHYLVDEQLLARNRPHGGSSAFEVLVPFELTDGRIIIVNRGWVAPGEGPLPDYIPEPPSEESVTVVVRLRPTDMVPRSGRGAPEGQVPTINLPAIAEITGENTITTVYGLMVSENPAVADVPHKVDPPTEDPGPHLSYAIQWILFAIMGFIFIIYIIRTERAQRREDAGGPAVKVKRRRDADAEQEDALLDA